MCICYAQPPSVSLPTHISPLVIMFVFYVCESVSVLYMGSFVPFFFFLRFRIKAVSHESCLCLGSLCSQRRRGWLSCGATGLTFPLKICTRYAGTFNSSHLATFSDQETRGEGECESPASSKTGAGLMRRKRQRELHKLNVPTKRYLMWLRNTVWGCGLSVWQELS